GQAHRPAFPSELARFRTATGFCVAGDTRDRSRGAIAVELERYLEQRAQSGEPFSAFEFASDFTDELRPRSVVADILSVGEGAREQFMFVPGLDALARSLARLSDTSLQIRNAAGSDGVEVALGEPED